jgi:hypothetical protein
VGVGEGAAVGVGVTVGEGTGVEVGEGSAVGDDTGVGVGLGEGVGVELGCVVGLGMGLCTGAGVCPAVGSETVVGLGTPCWLCLLLGVIVVLGATIGWLSCSLYAQARPLTTSKTTATLTISTLRIIRCFRDPLCICCELERSGCWFEEPRWDDPG